MPGLGRSVEADIFSISRAVLGFPIQATPVLIKIVGHFRRNRAGSLIETHPARVVSVDEIGERLSSRRSATST